MRFTILPALALSIVPLNWAQVVSKVAFSGSMDALQVFSTNGAINPAEEDALCGHVLGAMERHHVDYSAHALELIEGDRCVGLGLFYLSRALPPGDIGKIEALKVKRVYNSDKEMALH